MYITKIPIRWMVILCFIPIHPAVSGQINTKKILRETNHEILNINFSEDGKYLATIGTDNNVILWNTESERVYRTLSGLRKRPNAVVISDDDKYVFSAGEDKIISMWDRDPLSAGVVKTFSGHRKSIKALDISPDGKFLASGGEDRLVKIWIIETGEERYSLDGHSKDVNALKFSPDGSQLISGSADGSLLVWDVQSGSKITRVDYINAYFAYINQLTC